MAENKKKKKKEINRDRSFYDIPSYLSMGRLATEMRIGA